MLEAIQSKSKKVLDLSIKLQDEDTLYQINVHTTNRTIIKEFAFTFNQTADMHIIHEHKNKTISKKNKIIKKEITQ
jgi:hypothetical protein